MKESAVKEIVYRILEECGCIIFDNEDDEILEIDSMQYVSVIVQLEDEFDIIIDDQYLIERELTVNMLLQMLKQYLE